MERIRMISASLLMLSGVTHVTQVWVYGTEMPVVVAASFGVLYFIIGLLLLFRFRFALWLGAILPAIGGMLGIYRFFFLQPNPFTVFHVLIDIIVVPSCIYLLRRRFRPAVSA